MSGRGLIILIAALAAGLPGLVGETPRGLRGLAEAPVTTPERNWRRQGVASWELRLLERLVRENGVEVWATAYKSGDLTIASLLARPPIQTGEDGKPIPMPAVIFCHGSSQGLTAVEREVALEFARRGYVTAVSAYRGQGGLAGRSEGSAELGKGEVLDVLKLTALVRKLDYVDSLRLAIVGDGSGGGLAAQALGRSNVFVAAALLSPVLFSGMSQFNYAGIEELRRRSFALYGRDLTEAELIRELAARDAFRFASRVRAPTLAVVAEGDPYGAGAALWLQILERAGAEQNLMRYPGMFPGFLTALDDGERPAHWEDSRAHAWGAVFRWLDERLNPLETTVAQR